MDPGIRLGEAVDEDKCRDRSEGEDMEEELEIRNDGADGKVKLMEL